jgi:hypothetical protein
MARIHRPKPIAMAESSAHIVASIHPSPISGDPAVARWVCRRCLRGSMPSNQRMFLTFELYIRWCFLINLHNNIQSMVLLDDCFDWALFRGVGYYETTRGPRSDLWLGVVYLWIALSVSCRPGKHHNNVPNSFIDEGMKDWYKWMVSTQKGPGLLGWLLWALGYFNSKVRLSVFTCKFLHMLMPR